MSENEKQLTTVKYNSSICPAEREIYIYQIDIDEEYNAIIVANAPVIDGSKSINKEAIVSFLKVKKDKNPKKLNFRCSDCPIYSDRCILIHPADQTLRISENSDTESLQKPEA